MPVIKVPIGFFRDNEDDLSMMRLVVFLGAVYAGALIAAGIGCVFFGVTEGVTLSAIGAGIYTSGAILKGWQKKHEEAPVKSTEEAPCA